MQKVATFQPSSASVLESTQADVSVAVVEARVESLRNLMPYEAPEVVSMPLGGSKRIFPVYMGNM